MGRGLIALCVIALTLPVLPAEAAIPKPGARCSTLNEMDVARGKVYTCVRKGKKLVWNTGRTIPKPTPTPTAALPMGPPDPVQLTFSNVFEKRSFIRSNAWHFANRASNAGTPKLGAVEVLTGPNTRPYFEDFTYAAAQLSRLFPKFSEPERSLVIRYSAKDLGWASITLREKLSQADFQFLQWQHGEDPAAFACSGSPLDCTGGYQQTVPSGLAVMILGVRNAIDRRDPVSDMTTGMLEVHEYFHAVQRVPMLKGQNRDRLVWPGGWFREGSATWVQNAAMNANSFGTYAKYMIDLARPCPKGSRAEVLEFFESREPETLTKKFDDRWTQYCLGGQAIEVLVAVGGHESILAVYQELSSGISWEAAFEKVYGIKWADALPIVVDTVIESW